MVIGLISAVAVFFAGMGLYALAAPAALIRPFGVTLSRSESRAEVRAVYGGFGLAMAGVLVAPTPDDEVATACCEGDNVAAALRPPTTGFHGVAVVLAAAAAATATTADGDA